MVLGCEAQAPHCDTVRMLSICEDDWVHAKLLQSPQEEETFPAADWTTLSVWADQVRSTLMEPVAAVPFHHSSVDLWVHVPLPVAFFSLQSSC